MKYEKITKILNSTLNFLKFIKKHFSKIILLLIIIFFGLYSIFITYKNDELQKEKIQLNDSINYKIQEIDSLKNNIDSLKIDYDSLSKEYEEVLEIDRFLGSIAQRESSGNQWSVNKYGMLGLYQFNPTTLTYLGIKESKHKYLSDIGVQNFAMIKYLRYNNKKLNKYIKRFDGKIFKGIYITTSGILAGAHLMGAGGVMEFFDDTGRYEQYDGNDVHVSEYIAEFSGYKIDEFVN